MTSKKVPVLPLILGGAVLVLCCFAAVTVVVGGLVFSSGKGSGGRQSDVLMTPPV